MSLAMPLRLQKKLWKNQFALKSPGWFYILVKMCKDCQGQVCSRGQHPYAVPDKDFRHIVQGFRTSPGKTRSSVRWGGRPLSWNPGSLWQEQAVPSGWQGHLRELWICSLHGDGSCRGCAVDFHAREWLRFSWTEHLMTGPALFKRNTKIWPKSCFSFRPHISFSVEFTILAMIKFFQRHNVGQ